MTQVFLLKKKKMLLILILQYDFSQIYTRSGVQSLVLYDSIQRYDFCLGSDF